jgi:hypothetical protein
VGKVTSAQAHTFWALITASVVMLALVLAGGPRLARLQFRHKMETIRGDGVNAVLDGRLSQEEPVRTFLESLDLIAAHARWMTLARGVALVNGLRDLGVDDPDDVAPAPEHCDLPAGERRIMDELQARVETAFRSYLIWGSPAGWAAAPLVILASRVHPAGKIARTENALPVVAREAVRGKTAGHPSKTARWALRSQHG